MARFLIGSDSEVILGRGWPTPILPEAPRRRRVAVLTQPGARAVAAEAEERLRQEGLAVTVVELGDREEAKRWAALEEVYARLAAADISRYDTIVGVGGGALTDAAGFIGGTWLRGVETVHVPTTLLGAVDAAIGGKTAVNVAGKNLVGVFHLPRRVVVDTERLEQLPVGLKREGAAEVIKAGLLAAPEVISRYLKGGLDTPLGPLVEAAVAVKVEIVNADFREEGRRALLNLGHTIGHGVEFASGMSHGEAVAVGLVAAAAVSERRLGFAHRELVERVLEAVGLPRRAPAGIDRARVLELIGLDKKRDPSGTRMILLADLAHPQLVTVSDEEVAFGLAAIGL